MAAIRRLHEILRGVFGFEPAPDRKLHEHSPNEDDIRFLAQCVYRELGVDIPPNLLREMTPRDIEKEISK